MRNHSRNISYPRFISRGAKRPGELYSTDVFVRTVREITRELGLKEGVDWHLYNDGRRVSFSPTGNFDGKKLKSKIENTPELFLLKIS